MEKDKFFNRMENLGLALSFADVRLKTKHSKIKPSDVDLATKFSRNIPLYCPIVSSPMDTVTEHNMAIEMAKSGGIGIIHRKLSPKDQATEVARVKFYLNGLIKRPICVKPDETIEAIVNMTKEKRYSFHSFPVLDNEGKLIGLLTGNDFEFCTDNQLTANQIMSTDLVTAKGGISIEEAFRLMQESKKKILPLVDSKGRLVGMYIHSDVKRIISGGSLKYNLDENGNLRVGAAVGVGDEVLERVELMTERGIDVIVIDTAHGDSGDVFDTLRELKRNYPDLDVVVGNVSEGESAKRLVDAGADGVKVGQGPGSICTTRIVAGVGCPQVTAVYNCAMAIRGSDVPVCADGGIKYSGDITIALASGAETVMLGGMLAGSEEAPGETIMRQGVPVKTYRGMGSLEAMQESNAARERYGQVESESNKLVPEGVSGVVPYKGEVSNILFQCLGGLGSGMGYLGAVNIKELQERADFYRISGAGMAESHPHNITITKDAPNYQG